MKPLRSVEQLWKLADLLRWLAMDTQDSRIRGELIALASEYELEAATTLITLSRNSNETVKLRVVR